MFDHCIIGVGENNGNTYRVFASGNTTTSIIIAEPELRRVDWYMSFDKIED